MIVLGVDPGASTGWAMLACERGSRPVWLQGGTMRGDIETEFSLLMRDLRADVLAVETPAGGIYGLARAEALLASAVLAGWLRGFAEGRDDGPADVCRLSATDWRRTVVGRPNATDQQIARTIAMIVDGLPRRTNAHVRDAVGVAIGAASRVRR